jgi:SNARE protein 1
MDGASSNAGASALRARTKARELALARALAACERTTLASDVDARKQTQRLESLREILKTIEGDVDAAVWETYASRLDALVRAHSARRTEGTSTSGPIEGETTGSASTPGARVHAPARRAARPLSTTTASKRGVGGVEIIHSDDRGSPVATTATRPAHRPPSPKTLTADDEVELRRQRAIQEGLTDEISDLASGLKANALALERGLGRSSVVVAELESRLGGNVHGVKSSAKRQDAAFRANRRGSCWTWLILGLVGVLFAWTYVVIKVSSDRTKRTRAML